MLCTKCGKNEATVYFSRTVNGKKEEYNLCADCAKEMGLLESFNRHQKYIQNNFFGGGFFGRPMFSGMLPGMRMFDGFFKDFFDDDFFGAPLIGESTDEKCPYCGTTFEDYKKTGKFGCSMCYETFKDRMDKTAVGAAKTEKQEKKEASAKDKIAGLRAKIDEAVKLEKYEDAAKFRDEIKRLEGGGK